LASTSYSGSSNSDTLTPASKASNDTLTLSYLYDGNGNIISACNSKGEITAKLAYSPFGEKISGADLPFSFSTKAVDASGLAYYGFRFYNAETGRWLSRDPIGERGGVNLFAMVGNNAVGKWDWLGLDEVQDAYDSYQLAVTTLKHLRDFGASQLEIREQMAKVRELRDIYLALAAGAGGAGALLKPVVTIGAAVATGYLVGALATSLADLFGFWSDNEPDWSVSENGPGEGECENKNMVRVAVKRIATVKYSIGQNSMLVLFETHPTYWFEKSLKITYECCCKQPDENELKQNIESNTMEIDESWGEGWLGTAKHTIYFIRDTITAPCHMTK